MNPLTEGVLRASLVNSSLKERQNLTFPDLASLKWDQLDYLGWRDRKTRSLGYVVVELDGEPTGIVLRQADARPGAKAQCSWCQDVQLPNEVVFFGARRAGNAGRNGNTVGSLVCAHFECSVNVRRRPAMAYLGFDVDAERLRRIEVLRENVRNFVRNVRDS